MQKHRFQLNIGIFRNVGFFIQFGVDRGEGLSIIDRLFLDVDIELIIINSKLWFDFIDGLEEVGELEFQVFFINFEIFCEVEDVGVSHDGMGDSSLHH